MKTSIKLILFVLAVLLCSWAQTLITKAYVFQLYQQAPGNSPPPKSAYLYLDTNNHLVCKLPDGSSCL